MSKNKGVDYKEKYIALRGMFKESIDMAWRNGYELGAKEAQMNAMAQQAQQMMEQQAQMQQMTMQQAPQESPGEEGVPQGDEMDQAIGELEQVVNKSENGQIDFEELKKSMDKIKGSRSKVKSLSFLMNTGNAEKKEVSTQEKIVDDILKKWAEEEKSSQNAMESALNHLNRK